MNEIPHEEIFQLVIDGKSYREISVELQSSHPDIRRGLSERSVRRFITSHDLKADRTEKIEQDIWDAVQEVI